MGAKEVGATLRAARLKSKKTVQNASDILKSHGIKAEPKTLYSWESGNSQPAPDALLLLCELYGISDILSVFGYKNENSLAISGEGKLTESEQIFLLAYRRADEDTRELVNLALKKYMDNTVNGGSTAAEDAAV